MAVNVFLFSDSKYTHANEYNIFSVRYWLFVSWGRIGTNFGKSKTEPCKSRAEAVKKFESLFQQKTQNDWNNRGQFKKVGKNMINKFTYKIMVKYISTCSIEASGDYVCYQGVSKQHIVII